MIIQWLSASRLSMQRLGFCKAVLAFSRLARSSGQMADILQARLEEQKFTVPYDEARATWLKGLDRSAESNPHSLIGLQKLYVYGHPSRAGWLSRLAFREYVEYMPRHLGLVTASFEPTDMGLLLAQNLMPAEQHEAFSQYSTSNPLVLQRGEQIFFLYNLLAGDGDFLLPFCEALMNRFGDSSFNYLDAGALVPDTIGDILDRFAGSAYTQSDREQLKRLETARQQILKNIEGKAEEKGSGSRREQTTIPRLEWLVDVGATERVESRTWRFTEVGLKLTELTNAYGVEIGKRYPENVMAAILDLWFFGYVSRAYGYMPSQNVGRDKFVTFIWPAYQQLAGAGSYCLFRPLLLYANILSLHNHQGLFLQYEEATKLLEDTYQSDPTALQYTIDRYNTDYQIRIERTPETSEH